MNKKLDTKDLMEVKFAMDEGGEEKGIFTGYASIFGVLDSYGDIVDAGAFTKTLKNNNPVPMLWNHSVDEPIGVVHLKKDHTGLKAEGHLNLDVPRAQSVRSLMKQGAVKGLSIGYQTIKEDTDRELNARILKEVKLWEVSPVVFQACPGATVADVKSMEPAEDKPYPNEHACRIAEPGGFEDFRRTTRRHAGKEYSVIFGKRDDGTWEEQAYRYPKDTWSADEARAHCADHDGTFEAAKCAECSALPDEEPAATATPDEKPQAISKPEDKLHLLDRLILKF